MDVGGAQAEADPDTSAADADSAVVVFRCPVTDEALSWGPVLKWLEWNTAKKNTQSEGEEAFDIRKEEALSDRKSGGIGA